MINFNDNPQEHHLDNIFEQEVTLKNKRGLHARASAKFVKCAEQFSNTIITVKRDTNEVSGFSIMGLMLLGASYGTTVSIMTSSNPSSEFKDEAFEAIKQLTNLLENKFGENE